MTRADGLFIKTVAFVLSEAHTSVEIQLVLSPTVGYVTRAQISSAILDHVFYFKLN